MIIGSIDAFATNNGGLNFQQSSYWSLGSSAHGSGTLSDNFSTTSKYIHADLRAAKSLNGALYIATDGYLVKSSNNGGNWTILSEGTPIRENYTLGISQSNHFCSMIGSQDNGTSILGENGWVEFYGADGMEAIIHPLNPDYMIGSFQYGGRRRTVNRGLTSNSGHPTNESGSGQAAWVAPLTYNPNNPFEVYHFSQEVWKSDDFGSNWLQVGEPTSLAGIIENAAVAENNTNIMIVTRGSKIVLSTDGGVSYTNIFTGLPNATISDVAFDPRNDSTIFVVYDRYQSDGNKVFISENLGQTWSNITYNLNNMPIRAIVMDHSNSQNIYVGAEIGVYLMEKGGNTWSLYNSKLPNTGIRELEINYGSNTLRAATWGRGMWEYTLKDRLNFPAIMTTEITNPPTYTEPKADVPQFVTSKISYVGNLTSVYVEWSINAPTFGNVLTMSNISDSTWKTTTYLPNFPMGTDVFFKVFAVGSTGDTTETYKFMYRVRYNAQSSLVELKEDVVQLFPNPNSGKFRIELGETVQNGRVWVMTLDGKKVEEQSFQNTNTVDCQFHLKKGTYFVLVESDYKTVVRKMVVGK